MKAYADTSFLVSLYGYDTNNEEAARLTIGLGEPLAFTALHRHEMRNAFRLAVFRKEITSGQCRAVLADIETDIRSGVLAEVPLAWSEVFHEAEALSAAHTELLGTRSLDILHVASACALGAKVFLTFDNRQEALAKKAGLRLKG